MSVLSASRSRLVPRSTHEWMYISIKTTVAINIETIIAMQEMTTLPTNDLSDSRPGCS